jgi:hypothetical protein
MIFRVTMFNGGEAVGQTVINSDYDEVDGVPVTTRILAEMYVEEYLVPRGMEDYYTFIIT